MTDQMAVDQDLSIPGDDELELATTRGQYYKWLEDQENEAQLSFDEQTELTAEIVAANMEAMETAIFDLIAAHPTEFENYLQGHREVLGISDHVRSEWKDYLDSVVSKNTREVN